jgi:hypothetical protein
MAARSVGLELVNTEVFVGSGSMHRMKDAFETLVCTVFNGCLVISGLDMGL